MRKFFLVFLYDGVPTPPPSEYFTRYANPGEPQYTVARDLSAELPGFLRLELVELNEDIPIVLHLPIAQVRAVLEYQGDKPPIGFSVAAKG